MSRQTRDLIALSKLADEADGITEREEKKKKVENTWDKDRQQLLEASD